MSRCSILRPSAPDHIVGETLSAEPSEICACDPGSTHSTATCFHLQTNGVVSAALRRAVLKNSPVMRIPARIGWSAVGDARTVEGTMGHA
ncbi:MAG: hypothetical protein PVI08_05305 [Gammaproteobacteria bacterium]